MKRKIFSILFALVLVCSMSLVTAVPAAAVDDETTLQVVPFTLEGGGGTAEWTTDFANTGSSSVELHLGDGSTDYAELAFPLPGGITLADIDLDTTSFWCYSTDGPHIPYLMFELTPFGGPYEESFRINNDAALSTGYGEWALFNAATGTEPPYPAALWQWYDASTDEGGWETWDDLVDKYGTATVTGVYVGFSGLDATLYTAYVDDITVNGTTYYGQIQDAIDSTTGTTIVVGAGTYTENVNVDKSLTLQGESSATVTVTAANPAISVFNVTASSVNMSGFTVTGANVATTAGIYLGNDVALCNISNNILTGNGDGIWLGAGSNHNTLTNNIVSNNTWQGFEVYISDDNTFTGNTANSNTSYGFKIDSGSGNEFTNNIANSNGKWGFYVVEGDGGGATDTTFTGNTANLNTQYGIRINGGSDITLTDNTFNANVEAGIRLKEDITNLTLDNNSFTNSLIGIDIVGGVSGVQILDNCIKGNGTGIKLMESVGGVQILDNCIVSNGDGIWVENSNNIIGAEGHGNVISSNSGGDGCGVHLERTAFDNHINYNDINLNFNSGSGGFGVFNANFVPVDATNNWWGHVDGPSMGFIPFETLPAGDTISQYVNYEPFLTAPAVDAVAPAITYAAASPETVSIWEDSLVGSLWHEEGNMYSVGSGTTYLSVKASDAKCGIARVTKNVKQLVLDLIHEEVLDLLVEREYEGDWDEFWEELGHGYNLEAVEMNYNAEYGCWWEEGPINYLLYYVFDALNISSPPGWTPVLAQALQLGEKEIQVTAYDYSGNTATTTIPVTIVDFQMPVCEGWNLRSTWLTLENNSWEDIIATTDAGNINSLLRWSGQNQRWEYYAGTGSTAGWYYGGSRVTSALMVPLEAYWLHALKSDQFGLVTLRQVTAPPTRQMYAGWNLAGAALAWDQPMLYASDGLVSIYQDATGNTGYTNVVSIHQHIESEEDYYICGTYEEGSYDTYFQQWNWVLTTSPGGDGGPPVFLTRGGGYWIFMQNEAVLAGFSTTPLTEAFWSHWYD